MPPVSVAMPEEDGEISHVSTLRLVKERSGSRNSSHGTDRAYGHHRTKTKADRAHIGRDLGDAEGTRGALAPENSP